MDEASKHLVAQPSVGVTNVLHVGFLDDGRIQNGEWPRAFKRRPYLTIAMQ